MRVFVAGLAGRFDRFPWRPSRGSPSHGACCSAETQTGAFWEGNLLGLAQATRYGATSPRDCLLDCGGLEPKILLAPRTSKSCPTLRPRPVG